MAYCCVPRCHSDGKRGNRIISFHEIPADEALREQWLKAIKRDDWVPNATSNYSRVCSRHLKETDFAEGKLCRLKKGIVPSLFPEYPSYMRPQPLKERATESIRRTSLVPAQGKENEPGRKRKKCQENIGAEETPEDNYQVVSPSLTLDGTNSPPGKEQQAMAEIDSEAPVSSDAGVSHQATQVDVGASNLAMEKAKWMRKERDLKSKLIGFDIQLIPTKRNNDK